MRAALLQLPLVACVAIGVSACSWNRFDPLTKNSPVELLEKPDSIDNGFGVSLATAYNGGRTQVLVGGTATTSGTSLFEISNGPGTTFWDLGYCSGNGSPCFVSSLIAGFANAQGPDRVQPLCFAVGSGAFAKQGLVMHCMDGIKYTLDMPQAAQDLLATAIAQNQPRDFPMATDRADDPVLMATLPEKHLAWFYPAKSTVFSELTLPAALQVDDPSFGHSLAVLAVDGGRVFALGMPGKSQVFLWKADGAKASYLGCLGGMTGLGRALAAGKVNSDGSDDLLVSDETRVYALDGAALFQLEETSASECSFPSTAPGKLLGSFACGSTSEVSGCEGSEFGAALAVGDLDGDGDGEVIVGAPKMTVRDQENAGALLVYDAEVPTDSSLAEARFMSSAEGGDELGRSIVAPHLGNHDIIAAGAPGHGKAALFYCSALFGFGAARSRCE
jgi:hypothetical protein